MERTGRVAQALQLLRVMARRLSIDSLLDDALRRGRETAFVHRRELRTSRWSYARVATTAFQFARELEARGVNRGDRVLFRAENSAEWVAAFFGCVLRGAVVVPLDVESEDGFVARVHEQVTPQLVLVGGGGDARCAGNDATPFIRLENLDAIVGRHAQSPYRAVAANEHDTVEIIFTSGTTAAPRGILITHRNLLSNLAPLETEARRYLRWERLVHPLRFLNLTPLSHVFGQFMGIFVPQMLGGEVHFQDSLNPSEVVETMRRQRISIVVTVPRLLDTLREFVERREDVGRRVGAPSLSQRTEAAARLCWIKRMWVFRRIHRQFGWKFWAFVAGGASLAEETERFWRRLGFAVIQGYGMTETASLITVNHPFKMGRGSVGRTLPGQEMKIDEHGEILVRGANISPGYWGAGGDPHPLTDEEGWLHTGDIGMMDDAGNIYFKGRRKEVIVTSAGINIHPEDLEAALNRQPEVRSSVVINLENDRSGPEPLAVLIMQNNEGDPARAVERANRTLARHQQMRRWVVWPDADFPRTPTHKIRKRDITERIKVEGEGMPKVVRDDISVSQYSSFILDAVTRIGGGAAARFDSEANLATDLKLDSLGRVELLGALEDRYQIEIDEAAFTAATTVGDVEKIVGAGAADVDAARSYPYPSWPQSRAVRWLRVALFYLLVLPITSALCWVRVGGRNHLRGLDGPALFVANHITFIDHALILSALPRRYRRRMAIAMEGERLRWWRRPPPGTSLWRRVRWRAQYVLVVTLFNTFPLPQKSGFRRSFAYAGESVDRSYSVLVFPEGTRTVDGRIQPFMAGTGLLAARLGVPVVPVRITGLFELKQQRRRFCAPPGRVSVTFGEPVTYSHGAEASVISADLQRRVASL